MYSLGKLCCHKLLHLAKPVYATFAKPYRLSKQVHDASPATPLLIEAGLGFSFPKLNPYIDLKQLFYSNLFEVFFLSVVSSLTSGLA